MVKTTKSSPSTIHRLLFRTANQAHGGVERWFFKEKIGVTHLQFGILRSLGQDSLTLNELARQMTFKPPSLLPSVDLLERRGYIIRRNDPRDRRKIELMVTARGRRVVDRVLSLKKLDPLSLAFKKMSVSKRKQLISLLTELGDAIKVNLTL